MRDIRIQRAINTMKLALNAHRTMLLTDPPKDAWKYYNVEDQLRAAIDGLNEIGAAEVEGDPVAELVHAMFRSGNSIPVTRILITREQYEAACAHRTGQGQTRMDTGLSGEKEAGSGRGELLEEARGLANQIDGALVEIANGDRKPSQMPLAPLLRAVVVLREAASQLENADLQKEVS